MEKTFNNGNIVLEDIPNGLKITFHQRRSIFVIFFLLFWLSMWIFFERLMGGAYLKILYELFKNGIFSSILSTTITKFCGFLFLTFWVVIWTIGGLTATYHLIREILGKQRQEVVVNLTTLIISDKVRGFCLSEESYLLSEINNFYVRKEQGYRRKGEVFPDTIRFDYEHKTISFGGSIEEAEGRAILEVLRERNLLKEEHLLKKS